MDGSTEGQETPIVRSRIVFYESNSPHRGTVEFESIAEKDRMVSELTIAITEERTGVVIVGIKSNLLIPKHILQTKSFEIYEVPTPLEAKQANN